MEPLQELGDGNAADAVAGASGTVPEGAGEEGLPHADGPQKMTFSCWASQCRLQRREQAAQAQPFQSADEIRSSSISKASARAQAALTRSGP